MFPISQVYLICMPIKHKFVMDHLSLSRGLLKSLSLGLTFHIGLYVLDKINTCHSAIFTPPIPRFNKFLFLPSQICTGAILLFQPDIYTEVVLKPVSHPKSIISISTYPRHTLGFFLNPYPQIPYMYSLSISNTVKPDLIKGDLYVAYHCL